MTTCTCQTPQRGDHDGLDGVHPVLGLVEDDRVLRLEAVGDLERVEAGALEELLAGFCLTVVERGEAVHELDVRFPVYLSRAVLT